MSAHDDSSDAFTLGKISLCDIREPVRWGSSLERMQRIAKRNHNWDHLLKEPEGGEEKKDRNDHE